MAWRSRKIASRSPANLRERLRGRTERELAAAQRGVSRVVLYKPYYPEAMKRHAQDHERIAFAVCCAVIALTHEKRNLPPHKWGPFAEYESEQLLRAWRPKPIEWSLDGTEPRTEYVGFTPRSVDVGSLTLGHH